MNLEKIILNKNNILDLREGQLNFAITKTPQDFYKKHEEIAEICNFLSVLKSSNQYINWAKELENIDIEFCFSNKISYIISIEDKKLLAEAVFKDTFPVYMKFPDGTYSIDHEIFPEVNQKIKLLGCELAISFLGKLGVSIWREIFNLIVVNPGNLSLYTVKEQFFKGNDNKVSEILNEMVKICNFGATEISSDLSGFKYLGGYTIPLKDESTGIKKLISIYPLLWLGKELGINIIFYGGYLDNNIHPELMRCLLKIYFEKNTHGCLVASLLHTNI